VSTLTIRLLGRPEIERDGVAAPVLRGHKTWAVLAYLALADQPVPRAQLSELLFADADDPRGALRWALGQLRRALDLPDALTGDPLQLRLPAGTSVDVLRLTGGDLDVTHLRGGLLDGVDTDAGSAFDAWLLVERRRLSGLGEAVLHDAAHAALAAGRPLDGAALATRSLMLNALDEDTHELLVRCLAGAGDADGARRQVAASEALFRRELGRSPDPRVARAADGDADSPPAVGDRAVAMGLLGAGRAALAAGAVEPGIACLRQSCAEARLVDDPALLAETLAATGVALVHAVRGRDEEGSALLNEALALAERSGPRALRAKVCRELGFVEVQAGRGVTAGRWLLRATQLADDDGERAAVLGVRGMALSDRAHYTAAVALLEESIMLAHRLGDGRQLAWSFAVLGRVHVLRGDLAQATDVVDRSLELVHGEGWLAFQPFPEALRAEIALREHETDRAAHLLEHAFAMGCRLGDPCWEALAGRVRGLVHETCGRRDLALETLRDAVTRSVRVADPYAWIHGHCLDALAELEITEGLPEADAHVSQLAELGARGEMRELVVRSALHRARLGDAAGLGPARLLGTAIDNPALHAELADHTGRHTVSW
jgi:DNA-binding SARP family transcriptional activator